jgi:uncharacterized membrane protein YccC
MNKCLKISFDSFEFVRRRLRRLILNFSRVFIALIILIILIVLRWLFTIIAVMIAFFAISTHHLKSIRVVVEFIITIFSVAFSIILSVAIVVSIIILNCASRRVKIELINSIVKLKSILLDVCERVRLLNLLDMIRYRFDFLRQTNDLF